MEMLRAVLATEAAGALPEGLEARSRDGFTAVFAQGHRRPRLFTRRRDQLRVAERHMRDLEALLPRGTVIAALPDTRLPFAEAERMIAANRPLLRQLADRFGGASQFQLRVDWDVPSILGKFRDTPEIAPLFAEAKVRAPAVAAAVERLAARLRARFDAFLGPLCREIMPLPVGEGVLYNCAILLPSGREMALDHVLAEIDSVWSDGFIIRLIGPAPAMSFAALQIRQVAMPELVRSEKRLSLTRDWTAPAVAPARKAALRALPPGADAAREVRSAADLLLAWERAGRPMGGVHIATPWSEGRADEAAQDGALAWAG